MHWEVSSYKLIERHLYEHEKVTKGVMKFSSVVVRFIF